MCPGGTEDVLPCLYSIFWPAFDPRSICIHKYWSCTPGRWGNKREGKEWVYQIWDRCRTWKENFPPLFSIPNVNHTASKRACLLAPRLDSFHQDSSPVGDLWMRAQKNRFMRSCCSPPGRCWLNNLNLEDFTQCCCTFGQKKAWEDSISETTHLSTLACENPETQGRSLGTAQGAWWRRTLEEWEWKPACNWKDRGTTGIQTLLTFGIWSTALVLQKRQAKLGEIQRGAVGGLRDRSDLAFQEIKHFS